MRAVVIPWRCERPQLPVDRTDVVIDHVKGVGLMVAQRQYPNAAELA